MTWWHWGLLAVVPGFVLGYVVARDKAQQKAILRVLFDGRERGGREMVLESKGKIRSVYVYVSLLSLERKGLVKCTHTNYDQDNLPRRFYTITAKGRRYA